MKVYTGRPGEKFRLDKGETQRLVAIVAARRRALELEAAKGEMG